MRLLVSVFVLSAGLVSACSNQDPGLEAVPNSSSLGHIHGLGIDPADGSLFVATHTGLFRVGDEGDATRVANRYQDTMAFTVTGPGEFLGSGHPDLREDLPSHLGLIESTDAGETWEALALQGEADFHALDVTGQTLYAYDALTQRLLRTEDRQDFEEVLTSPIISLAATVDDEVLYVITPEARVMVLDTDTSVVRDLEAPAMLFLDTRVDGTDEWLVGIGPDGAVHTSADDGTSWVEVGTLDAQPVAFTVTDQGWYAGTETGVYQSEDDGRTWTLVVDAG